MVECKNYSRDIANPELDQIAAILELVWNALDADATVVEVSIDANELGGVESIIELKRPTEKITSKAIHQTRSYAKAIANDERFKGTDTKWTFIALSNDLDDIVQDDARQPEKPPGLVFEDPNGRYKVWAKRWSEIIDDARARLSFFQEKFAIEMAEGVGLEHMRRVYAKHLPTEDLTLQEDEDCEAEEATDKPNESAPSKKGRRAKRTPKQPAPEAPADPSPPAPQDPPSPAPS